MPAKEFQPGFRLSATDAAILALGALGVWLFSGSLPLVAFIIGCAVGHFFLFCNVFRISRISELIWASCFVVLVMSHARWSLPTLPWLAVGALTLATVLIALEMRKPGYHGIFWRTLNPGLENWWKHQN